jgi:hypothetical protein
VLVDIRLAVASQALRTTVLIDEFCAEFVTDPPCQPALACVIGREDDGEMRGNFEIFRDNLHAAIRNVRNCTVTWQ